MIKVGRKKRILLCILLIVFAFTLSACDAIYIKKKGSLPGGTDNQSGADNQGGAGGAKAPAGKEIKTYDVYGDGKKIIKIEDGTIYGDNENVSSIFPQTKDNYTYLTASGSVSYKMDENILDTCTILDIKLNGGEQYYEFTHINDGHAFLYVIPTDNPSYKGKTITVNAGHGVIGGSKIKTYSHPDMSPKMSGGTNKEGEVFSTAISEGMTFLDGRLEADENLVIAKKLRDLLLLNGYNVLMIREDNNSRFDNVSRTILANGHSDIHISIHFDSTETDKGAFVIVPIEKEEYLNMEPVKFHYKEDNRLANAMLTEWKDDGINVWSKGKMGMDLTQISYSNIPTVDLELGDKATVLTEEIEDKLAEGIFHGIENYFGFDENYVEESSEVDENENNVDENNEHDGNDESGEASESGENNKKATKSEIINEEKKI